MNNRHDHKTRVLAIDPNRRGFGYVIFEGPESLIDWGVPKVRSDKHRKCLRRVGQLLDTYAPDVLVLEDIGARGCRRCPRVRRLLRAIASLGKTRNVRVTTVARSTLVSVFADIGCHNKDDVAEELVRRHPALAHRLPRRRKCWMSEDEGMSIFDATALYVTHLTPASRLKRAA